MCFQALAVRETMASPRHRVKVGHSQDWGLELDTTQGKHEQQEPDVQHFLRYNECAVQCDSFIYLDSITSV